MIQFDNVGKRYPDGYEALKAVSFKVERGEMALVTGHSGAGKSTLLKLAAGIDRPDTGRVVIGGQDVARLRTAAFGILRRSIGFVFQDHRLLLDRTVFDNAALPLQIEGYGPRDVGKRVRAALDKVGLLDRERKFPLSLSGGEQQRLCIARAIVNRPSILLADEPTGNLDREYSRVILDMFMSFHQAGVTLLMATHDPAALDRFSGRRIDLHAGRVIG